MAIIKSYEGAEPCPCCGIPGSQKPRRKKNGLCNGCEHLVEIGKVMKDYYEDMVKIESKEIGVGYMKYPHCMVFDLKGKDLRQLFIDFIKSIPMPKYTKDRFDKFWYESKDRILNEGSINVSVPDFLIMPRHCFQAANELFKKLDEVGEYLENKEKMLFNEYNKTLNERLDKEVFSEQEKIFQKGVEHGKNLLLMLNRGEISANNML